MNVALHQNVVAFLAATYILVWHWRSVEGEPGLSHDDPKCACVTITLPSESPRRCQLRNVWGADLRLTRVEPRDPKARECGTADCNPRGAHGSCEFAALTMEAPSTVEGNPPDGTRFPIRTKYAPRFCSSDGASRSAYAEFAQSSMSDLGEFNTPGLLQVKPSARRDFALVAVPDGCVHVTRPSVREQVIANRHACILRSYLRGEAVCPRLRRGPSASRTVRADTLVHAAYGKNRNNFQHFFLDHLGPLLAAEEQLRSEPRARFLVDINGRSREILAAAGFPMGRLVHFTPGTKYCARQLLIPAVLPLDQTLWARNRSVARQVWPPEDFVFTSQRLGAANARSSGAASRPRDLIIFASRGSPPGKPHLSATGRASSRPSRNIENEAEVVGFLRRFVAERPSLGLEVVVYHGGFTSIEDSLRLFQRARAVVGVHGANMANIAMARADKGTAVVEFVGVRNAKYERFLSYFYFGRASALDYYTVPKVCLDGACAKTSVRVADIELALLDVFGSPQHNCTSPI